MMRERGIFTIIISTGLLLLSAPTDVFADNIRGRMADVTRIANGSEPSGIVSLRLEENCGIFVDDDRDLVRGIEVLVDLPEQAQAYPGTYALFVYGGVKPLPDVKRLDYQGNLLFFKQIGTGKRLFVQLPLGSSAGFAPVADTIIAPKPLMPASFPIVFTFLPIMKGLPSRAAEAVFKVQVRPMFKNLGKLLVELSDGKNAIPLEKAKLFVDDRGVPLSAEGMTIEPGIHRVRIEVEGFTPFVATVGVDKGKVAKLTGNFLKSDALVRINAPSGTRAFLDGKSIEVEKKELSLEPGEHILAFKVGDYQISKKFRVEAGKNYAISLFLDILINED